MPHSGGLKNLSGTVGATTITGEQLAIHHHPMMSFAQVNYTNGDHSSFDASGNVLNYSGYAGGSQPHTHAWTGASGDANSLPPYYALALIMRIA